MKNSAALNSLLCILLLQACTTKYVKEIPPPKERQPESEAIQKETSLKSKEIKDHLEKKLSDAKSSISKAHDKRERKRSEGNALPSTPTKPLSGSPSSESSRKSKRSNEAKESSQGGKQNPSFTSSFTDQSTSDPEKPEKIEQTNKKEHGISFKDDSKASKLSRDISVTPVEEFGGSNKVEKNLDGDDSYTLLGAENSDERNIIYIDKSKDDSPVSKKKRVWNMQRQFK